MSLVLLGALVLLTLALVCLWPIAGARRRAVPSCRVDPTLPVQRWPGECRGWLGSRVRA